MSVFILRLEASNLNIKQTKGTLKQYVDSKLDKRRNSGGGCIASNGEHIPHKLANSQASNKNKGGVGGGDKSNTLRGKDKEVYIT